MEIKIILIGRSESLSSPLYNMWARIACRLENVGIECGLTLYNREGKGAIAIHYPPAEVVVLESQHEFWQTLAYKIQRAQKSLIFLAFNDQSLVELAKKAGVIPFYLGNAVHPAIEEEICNIIRTTVGHKMKRIAR